MIIELGNENAVNGLDDHPKVTYLHIPEADSTGRGGYTHVPGISAKEFKDHWIWSITQNNGITHLPDHEILLAAVNAWPGQSSGGKPSWIKATSHEDLHGPAANMHHPEAEGGGPLAIQPHGSDIAADIEAVLSEFWEVDQGKPANIEDTHWTRYGAPGVALPPDPRPDVQAVLTNAGRVIANNNDGGGQVGLTGTGSAATATTLTTGQTMTTNAWAGYRVYVMQTATGPIIWGNVISNTAAGVLTVDRWYSAATPGGAAPAAPSAGFYYLLADGGMPSAWFVALSTTNITPAVADTVLAGEYTTAGGGMVAKIAPYAQTSGVASRSLTLTPVFTANATDVGGGTVTFYAIAVRTSMLPGAAGWPTMKFETSLNSSFAVSTAGDNATITETVSGS